MKFSWVYGLVTLGDSWGPDGHRIVAEIAQRLLEPTAERSVASMLNGSPMWTIATWADEIDHTPEFAWTKCMHYIDSSVGVCSVSTDTDCAHNCCVVKAIGNYTNQIIDKDPKYVTDALKFLVHFMGDVHQPLHAGHREDKGGNMINVVADFSYSHRRENLHEVWDGVLIKRYLNVSGLGEVDGWKRFADMIVENIRAGVYPDNNNGTDCGIVGRGESCALSAALESASNACEFAYVDEQGTDITSGSHLSESYYSSRIVVIEERLALAGIRLSEILNSIFPHEESFSLQVE